MVQIAGVVSKVVWRDRRFGVVEVVAADGTTWSVSGQMGSVMVEMPFVADVEARPQANAAYGEQFRLVTRADAPAPWRRLAGVTAWHEAAGGGGAEILAAVAALRWAVGGGEVDLSALPTTVRHAAALGEAGCDWLAEVSVRHYGWVGPDVVAASPCSFVASGLLEADEALRVAAVVAGSVTERQRCEAATGLVVRQLVRTGRSSMSTRRVRSVVTEALGVAPSALVGEGLSQLGASVVPTELVEAEAAVEGECRRISDTARALEVPAAVLGAMSVDGATVAQHAIESPLSVVVSPAGCDGGFLRDVVGGLGDLVGVSVRHADCRGSLIGRWGGAEHACPSVVVLTDVHRLGAWGLVQALAQVDDGCRVVAVGDDWQWAPGTLDGVFIDLVRGLGVPVAHLRGSGAAWALRGGSDVRSHPAVHAGAPPEGVVARRLAFSEPAALVERKGSSVMVVERHAELGIGILGQLAHTRGEVAVVDCGRAIGERRVPRRILAGGDRVAFGWLPGVRCKAVRLTKPMRSVQGAYAVLAAATEVWCDDPSFLANLSDEPVHGPGVIGASGDRRRAMAGRLEG